MTHTLASRFVLTATVVLSLGTWIEPVEAQERRCSELGSNCICSEPLNTNTYASGAELAPGKNSANPADSTGSTQCDGEQPGTGYARYPIEQTQAIAAGSLVANNFGALPVTATVNYVMNAYGGSVNWLKGKHSAASSQRVCIRNYIQFRSDTDPGGSCNNKMMEFDGWGGDQIIMNPPQGTTTPVLWISPGWSTADPGGGPTNNKFGTGTLTINDCIGHWCRSEMCVGGNVQAGTGITMYGYLVRVDAPATRRDWNVFLGNARGSGGISGSWIVNAYHQGCSVNSQALSMAMQAEWNTDSGQFIGPAYEIENGAGGTTGGTTGGATSPPVAPTLLP